MKTPVGLSFETGGMVVVTESHIVQLAGLSGDFFDLYMDDEYKPGAGSRRACQLRTNVSRTAPAFSWCADV